MPGARARLKQAHAEIQKLVAEVDEAKSAVRAAEVAVQEDEQDLETFADLDQEITKYRALATRRRQDPRKLPDNLRARLDARRAAEEELELAASTLDVLRDDLTKAEATLRGKRTGLSRFAVEVVQEIADAAADELLQMTTRYTYLRFILSGLSEARVLDGNVPLGIPNTDRISEALALRRYPDPMPGITAESALGKRWEARVFALIADPDAVVTLPQPVRPDAVVIKTPGFVGAIGSFDLRPEE